jgi:putative nucleotidyltransferase with HDIG domain
MTGGMPTRKKIAKDQLRLGMYIDAIDGAWLDHPFWKARFLLSKQSDLDTLRSSAIDAVVIDTSKGLDVQHPVSPVLVEAVPPARAPSPTPASAKAAKSTRARKNVAKVDFSLPDFGAVGTAAGPASLVEEFDRAGEIVHRASEIVTQLFDEVRLGKTIEASQLRPLVDAMAGSLARNRSAMSSIVRLKSKDEYTYMHSVAVSTLMVNLARELKLGPEETQEAGVAGLLHDIGKMAVPTALLQKAGPLSDTEFKVVRTHPVRGHAILTGSEGVSEAALDVCLHHHEKMDGTGYPDCLSGDKISLFARMGAVCDVYDAVTSNRPYKAAWTPPEALARMYAWKGHFDPATLAAFIRSLGIYPVGSLVRLKSGTLAIVREQTADLTRPFVRIFLSTTDRIHIPVHDLDLSNMADDRMEDGIVASEHPNLWRFPDWERYWPTIIAAQIGKPISADRARAAG